jgi:hypothetical protein
VRSSNPCVRVVVDERASASSSLGKAQTVKQRSGHHLDIAGRNGMRPTIAAPPSERSADAMRRAHGGGPRLRTGRRTSRVLRVEHRHKDTAARVGCGSSAARFFPKIRGPRFAPPRWGRARRARRRQKTRQQPAGGGRRGSHTTRLELSPLTLPQRVGRRLCSRSPVRGHARARCLRPATERTHLQRELRGRCAGPGDGSRAWARTRGEG